MLSRFDDYPIHQIPEPLAHAGSSDRNFYDRYFFHGYAREGDLFFGAALGLYPNRRVMDAALSAVRGGVQHALHASRLAPAERGETRVGPLCVEVLEPLRALRLRVPPNATGLACDAVFRARCEALEEPRAVRSVDGRVFLDSTRFTQLGAWEGWLEVAGERVALDPARVWGARDRSWGVRPVGEREAGAPGAPPQLFWLWAPIQFEDRCAHVGIFEDAVGDAWHAGGALAPVFGHPGAPERARRVAHRIRWEPGTRRAAAATLEIEPASGEPLAIELAPVLRFQMLGLGYLHPEWGHGMWKGPEAQAGESWRLADVNALDPRFVHVQQLCRARLGAQEGLGVLEQLVIGPHAPSGFTSLLDGAKP